MLEVLTAPEIPAPEVPSPSKVGELWCSFEANDQRQVLFSFSFIDFKGSPVCELSHDVLLFCCLASEIYCSTRFDLARKRKRPRVTCRFSKLLGTRVDLCSQTLLFRTFRDYQHACHHNSSWCRKMLTFFRTLERSRTFQGLKQFTNPLHFA